MYYLSISTGLSFEEAVTATRSSLARHHLVVLAEIDLTERLREDLAIELRPYIIFCTCNLELAHRAIQCDNKIGSILLCELVIQKQQDGCVEISVADPMATIGTSNHVELTWIARDLRSILQQVLNEVKILPVSQRDLQGSADVRQQLAHEQS